MRPEQLAQSIEGLVTAYVPGAIVAAAVELGLFDVLAEEGTIDELASRLGASPDGVGRLVRALVALDLIVRRGERFVAPPEVRAVLAREGILGPIVLHHARQIAPLLARLPDAIRTGGPQHGAWPFAHHPPATSAYGELARHPDEYRTFLAAMDRASAGVGERIATTFDVAAVDRVIDLGGGGGAIARALLAAAPVVRVDTVELGPACAYARERSVAAGLSNRHTLIEGDLREPIALAPAPMVVLAGVLADFDGRDRGRILDNARGLLAPGGVLVVCETLLDEDRVSPPGAAILSLVLLAAFSGDQLTESELRALLGEASFSDVEVHLGAPGERALVAARVSQ